MKKAASIFLRAEIYPQDVEHLIRWMANPRITQYLHEDPAVIQSLQQLLATVPAPMLTFQFNQWGRFFVVCDRSNAAIGFVKLKALTPQNTYEIVYVIGEEALWGNGYGKDAILAALSTAFFEWRARKVVAKIYPGNLRSIRAVQSCGFSCDHRENPLFRYSITMDDYLDRLRA